MDSTIQRIISLIEMNNDTPARVLKEINLSTNSISEWKKGKGRPSTDAIIKFAQYYNVSTDYLLLGKLPEDNKDASLLQKQLDNIFIQLDEGDQRECIGFAKCLLQMKDKKDSNNL